jgi:hypothetical protein
MKFSRETGEVDEDELCCERLKRAGVSFTKHLTEVMFDNPIYKNIYYIIYLQYTRRLAWANISLSESLMAQLGPTISWVPVKTFAM